MSLVPNSYDYPSRDDRQHLTELAEPARESPWLMPVAEATVALVRARLASSNPQGSSDDDADPVRFVQEAYADLQEFAWGRHVADDSALGQFRQQRPPKELWPDFMKQRIVELTKDLTEDDHGGLHREFVQICLVLLFFHSCRHRNDSVGITHSLHLFEAFLGPGRSRDEFPIYDVMEFYASCVQFEQQMLGERAGVPCPTADTAREIVDRNRALEPPTQPEETMLDAISRIASLGRAVVKERSNPQMAQANLGALDELVVFGIELVEAGRDRGIRYFTAQAAASLHVWRNEMDQALDAAAEAVRGSSAQPIAFWLPEMMKLRNIVTEANRNETERRLDARIAEAEASFGEKVERVEEELSAKVGELSKQLATDAKEASDSASRRAIVPVIEVLGIFVAVLAVAASTVGAAVASGLDFWQRIAVIAAGSAGALLVLGMIRLQLRPSRRDKS